jgi:hypothetical protein
MQCPHCRTHRPESEILCGECGKPFYVEVSREKRLRSSIIADFRRQLAKPQQEQGAEDSGDRWERSEVVVPLGLELPKGSDFTDAFKARFEVLVHEALVRPRVDGWQPDGPTSLRALGLDRFTTRPTGLLKNKVVYESVRLLLKRPRLP